MDEVNRILVVLEPEEYSKVLLGLINHDLTKEERYNDSRLGSKGVDNLVLQLHAPEIEICFINKSTI